MTTRNKYPADQGRGYFRIERRAREARHRLGFGPDEYLPSVTMFERLEGLSIPVGELAYPVTWEVAYLPDGVEGQTRFDPDEGEFVVALAPDTYWHLDADQPRARFSVGHEIGHLFLHAQELVRMTKIPEHQLALLRSSARNIPPYQDTEWQAEAFGGAFLMPAEALRRLEVRRGSIDHRTLRQEFGVSDRAARTRLRIWMTRRVSLLDVVEI